MEQKVVFANSLAQLDDFRILKALDELGYEGFVECEYRPAAGTLDGLGWLRAMR